MIDSGWTGLGMNPSLGDMPFPAARLGPVFYPQLPTPCHMDWEWRRSGWLRKSAVLSPAEWRKEAWQAKLQGSTHRWPQETGSAQRRGLLDQLDTRVFLSDKEAQLCLGPPHLNLCNLSTSLRLHSVTQFSPKCKVSNNFCKYYFLKKLSWSIVLVQNKKTTKSNCSVKQICTECLSDAKAPF